MLNCLSDQNKHSCKRKFSEHMSSKVNLDAVDDYDADKVANGDNMLSLKILGDSGRLGTPTDAVG